jgi:DNA-binding NarL/FixJ family response regulator
MAHALGTVLTAEGDPSSALAALRRAHEAWCALDAPYHAARTRVAIAAACAALGDADSAEAERSAAAAVFEELGAVVDLRALSGGQERDHPLTDREVQVLRLVAGGLTNRAIGAELVLSERTVERHLSNIFAKVGVSTRAAATAYAFEHRLV